MTDAVPKRRLRKPIAKIQDAQVKSAARVIQTAQLVSPLELQSIVQAAQIREVASIEFITDPNQHPIEWHYNRTDRPWRRLIDLKTWQSWAVNDRWVERRKEYSEQMRHRLLQHEQNKAIKRRIAQLDELDTVRSCMLEYLSPLKNKDGSIKRHAKATKGKDNPLAGLPVFALELGNVPQLLKRFIDLEQHMVDMRAAVPDREDSTEVEKPVTALLPPGTELTKDEVNMLAKLLLKSRQPELQDQPDIFIKPTKGGKNGAG